ncbi:flippase [Vibrio splendidus]
MSVLIRRMLNSAGVQLFGKALAVTTGIVLARTLGPEDYGVYSLCLSVIAIFMLPVIAGVPNLIIREISYYLCEKDWGRYIGVIKWSRAYVLLTSACMVVVMVFFYKTSFFSESSKSILLIAAILIPIKGLIVQQGAILNGLSKPSLSLFVLNVASPLIMLAFITYDYLWSPVEESLIRFIYYLVIANVIGAIISEVILKKAVLEKTLPEQPKYELSKWNKAILPFSLMAIIGTLNIELSSVFLGYFSSKESVGYFKVAMQGVGLVALSLTSINAVIGPNIASTYKLGNLEVTQQILRQSVRMSSIIGIPFLLILCVFGEEVIILLFGKEYIPSVIIILILSVGQVFNVIFGSVNLILNMIGKEKEAMKIITCTLFINLILLLVLVPKYHEVGAALSTSISMVFWNVLMSLKIRKEAKLISWLH